MASESRTFGASRSKAPFAGFPSWPSAKLRANCLLFSASAPSIQVGVAVALFLPAHATAARSRPGCACGSIPPVAGLAGSPRPVGSTPTSRVGTVARRPSVGCWFGSGNSATSPAPWSEISPSSPAPLRFAAHGSLGTPETSAPRAFLSRFWWHSKHPCCSGACWSWSRPPARNAGIPAGARRGSRRRQALPRSAAPELRDKLIGVMLGGGSKAEGREPKLEVLAERKLDHAAKNVSAHTVGGRRRRRPRRKAGARGPAEDEDYPGPLLTPGRETRGGAITLTSSTNVICIDTDAGITGIGEGGTKDTLEHCASALIGQDPAGLRLSGRTCFAGLSTPPASKSCMRLAAWIWPCGTLREKPWACRFTHSWAVLHANYASATAAAARGRPPSRKRRAQPWKPASKAFRTEVIGPGLSDTANEFTRRQELEPAPGGAGHLQTLPGNS